MIILWNISYKISDGVVISGGAFDISPHHYGQSQKSRLITSMKIVRDWNCNWHVDVWKNKTSFGYLWWNASDGSCHRGKFDPRYRYGNLQMLWSMNNQQIQSKVGMITEPTGQLYDIYGSKIRVNSTHHQSVDHPGAFVVTGKKSGWCRRSFEHPKQKCSIGVQWHPEFIDGKIFQYLIHCSL